MKNIFAAFFCFCFCFCAFAQQPTLDSAKVPLTLDTALLATDTAVVAPVDTITPQLLRLQDGQLQLHILDSLTNGLRFQTFNLQHQLSLYNEKVVKVVYQTGDSLPRGERWILGIIAFLLVLFAFLKNSFGKQLWAVVQSFYSNRALNAFNKEERLLTSWSFLLLFVQFGFTIGMFFFLAARFEGLPEVAGGFQFFMIISLAIIVLYLLKILVLRLIGFIFGVQKALSEYVSILYLSYFNVSLLFIPLVILFALSPMRMGGAYLIFGGISLLLIFVFQFFRATVTILSQYRFPIMYLFLYFCTLEICPILILIKAIGLK